MKSETEIIKKAIDAINCAGLQIEVLEQLRNRDTQLNTSIETKEILLEAKIYLKTLLENK